ncbi:hypothetical protein [Bacillus sp. EB01]|uniref:hypothetical protein n=1 Tax=Bacillus sp. EB01 TaxID=1347086 RepID=UPI0012DCBA80|nr:hypothetical protein [Bacillus sp. EB01]
MDRLKIICKQKSKTVISAQLRMEIEKLQHHLSIHFTYESSCEIKMRTKTKQFDIKLNHLDKEIYVLGKNEVVRAFTSVPQFRKWIIGGCS